MERSREKGVHADHLCERPQEGPPAHVPSPAGGFLIKETFSLKILNRGEEKRLNRSGHVASAGVVSYVTVPEPTWK